MSFDPTAVKAIIFDYGNTLIRFDNEQLRYTNGEMTRLLEDRCGPIDHGKFDDMRHADRMLPYRDGYRESRLVDLFVNHVQTLFGIEPDDDLLGAMAEVRFRSFVDVIEIPRYVLDVLDRLRQAGGYRLGVLSNYPDGDAIRASMVKIDLSDRFDAIVASGDVGRVKPHSLMFETVLRELDVKPDEALHVGDNWLADIQGAKRSGILACHMTQWDPPERFERDPGDHEPDAAITHLTELPMLLGID